MVVANSGNANACTGERGMRDAEEMARLAAAVCQAVPEQALVLSTGIIGHPLPMDKIAAGVTRAAQALGVDEAAWIGAARGSSPPTAPTKWPVEHSPGPMGTCGSPAWPREPG